MTEAARLQIQVVDENQRGVSAAQVTLKHLQSDTIFRGITDYAGYYQSGGLPSGQYHVRVEKKGFFSFLRQELDLAGLLNLEVLLIHEHEFREEVDVVYSEPPVDPSETAESETLDSEEIINLPYSASRDIRNILPFIPGVVRGRGGQIHVAGSDSREVHMQLDGFNVAHPASGLLELRMNPDALRSIQVLSSRYSAEFGKGSGGVLRFETAMGDDRLRYSATDFVPTFQIVPTFQNRKDFTLDNWTPRATISGPLARGKAWFLQAVNGEYGIDVIEELPLEEDRKHSWRFNTLTKVQVNLGPSNIATASFLYNAVEVDRAGLSRFDPLETTHRLEQGAYLFTLKDQVYLPVGLIETGFAMNKYWGREEPRGRAAYRIEPRGSRGNFFRRSDEEARRSQFFISLTFPVRQWRGEHEFKVGTGLDRLAYAKSLERNPILILREDGTLSRKVTFIDSPPFEERNWETGFFAQDRWSASDSLLFEFGVRADRDSIIRQWLVSPRFSFNYLLPADGWTKLSAGIGVFRDATSLEMIARPLEGRSLEQAFGPDGEMLRGVSVQTGLEVERQSLQAPASLNWSLALHRAISETTSLQVEFQQKRGRKGFSFVPGMSEDDGLRLLTLRNVRWDRYRALQLSLRRTFKTQYVMFVSYTRSSARTNTALDLDSNTVISGSQAGGPLPWDAPNRLISWGWMPLGKGFNLAYSVEFRDGFPFNVVNENQELVEPPNSRRLPAHFSLNLHAEKVFQLMNYRWGLRVGLNNLTKRANPEGVNNNIDSPHFLTFGSTQSRALVARIRLLGRK